MNALRAVGFTTSSRSRLQPVTNWPQLPATMILDRVVGIGVDSRGLIYVAHRGEQPLFCLNADGTFCREVGADVHRKSIAYDRRGIPGASDC